MDRKSAYKLWSVAFQLIYRALSIWTYCKYWIIVLQRATWRSSPRCLKRWVWNDGFLCCPHCKRVRIITNLYALLNLPDCCCLYEAVRKSWADRGRPQQKKVDLAKLGFSGFPKVLKTVSNFCFGQSFAPNVTTSVMISPVFLDFGDFKIFLLRNSMENKPDKSVFNFSVKSCLLQVSRLYGSS